MKKERCTGCKYDYYNYGKNSSTGECWLFAIAQVIKRRRVGMNERPPWEREPEFLPDCYRKSGYIFVHPDTDR